MVPRALIALACCAFLCCGSREITSQQSNPSNAIWIADPGKPGPDQPPAGRSLFDALVLKLVDGKVVYNVPFPFEKLTALIKARSPQPEEPLLRQVLIPIGRSLQRDANMPDYFGSPRVVVAVDRDFEGESSDGPLFLKDRLFLGYQAKSAIIEVISYNEEAGRFEFQIVHDYKAGTTPRVQYAERAICVACHQGHGPIFPRPLWDETNANEDVRAYLREHAAQFYGVAVEQGVDAPQLIDDATDRANLFPAYQLLWREGCADSYECRADALVAMLQYRLSGLQHSEGPGAEDRERFSQTVSTSWREKWPAGLKVPNPDIPNRNPLETARRESERTGNPELMRTAGTAQFAALAQRTLENPVFEPRTPREPLDVWSEQDAGPEFYKQVVAGLASFFSQSNIRVLDNALFASREDCDKVRYEASCNFAVERESGAPLLRFACNGAGLEAGGWGRWAGGRVHELEISRLVLPGGESRANIYGGVASSTVGGREHSRIQPVERSGGLHARLASGGLIGEIELSWQAAEARANGAFPGKVEITAFRDLARIRQAIGEMASARSDALSRKPLRSTVIMVELMGRL